MFLQLMLILSIVGVLLEVVATIYFGYVATMSVLHDSNTEKCESFTGIPQKVTDSINTGGTFLINVLAIMFTVIIHRLDFYSSKDCLTNMLSLEYFWTCLLCVISVAIPTAYVHDFKQASAQPILYVLGSILIVEYSLTFVFAISIHFMELDILDQWLKDQGTGDTKVKCLKSYYKIALFTFFLRNLLLFLYEIYGIAIKLHRVSIEDFVFLDFVLQVMNAAFRGSSARFFFVTIFKNIMLEPVINYDDDDDEQVDQQQQQQQQQQLQQRQQERNKAMLPALNPIESSQRLTYIKEYDPTLLKRV